jgi:hypothetical protein
MNGRYHRICTQKVSQNQGITSREFENVNSRVITLLLSTEDMDNAASIEKLKY